MNFITGDKFIELADWTYAPVIRHQDDYCKLKNTLDLCSIADGDIIYTHTFYVKQLFEILKGCTEKVYIITHNSDMNIDDTFTIPRCVVTWYAQNVNIFDSRIVPIPIGLENDRWFPTLRKKELMVAKLQEPREYKGLVYMNFNLCTNFTERSKAYNALKDKEWVKIHLGTNGSNFPAYLDNLYNYKFVVCPEGNGIDTHRVWETLYMGSFPIVLRNAMSEYLYSYYPCYIVDSWEEITEDSLAKEYKNLTDIMAFYDHSELLTFDYWRDKILNRQ